LYPLTEEDNKTAFEEWKKTNAQQDT
jgi:hypothetical protein